MSVDMKTNKSMTIDELVQRFTEIALSQHVALRNYEVGRFNRLFDQMEAVENELKARDGDKRKELLILFGHPNPQVRLKAAVATLAVAPKVARELLQVISDSDDGPQAGDAGMTLLQLDRGAYKPT
jgi:hypothetical protein